MNAPAPAGRAAFDLIVIGGGINGAGIARDAAGRGYSVALFEAGDFGCATSSASTKLIHGGLRYLEYFEFRLVREALAEREILLRAMPHIARPMRFVLPVDPALRLTDDTPMTRLLRMVPGLRGRRPAWMIRLGLWLYDRMGGRGLLPGTRTLDLTRDEAGRPLRPGLARAFEYSDGWVDDSRLVILNLVDAARRGAVVRRSAPVVAARHDGRYWQVTARQDGRLVTHRARMVVNAAGPSVDRVLADVFGVENPRNLRLVRGSHIVIRRKYAHDRAYFLQNPDGRILFAIPYEGDFTLIGTTDVDHPDPSEPARISEAETDYLCRMASRWFADPVTRTDIVWTYSGVRPLCDDGATAAQAATRDYVLRRQPSPGGGTLVNVFGGKITTYRRLGEAALRLVEETLGRRGPPWTAHAPLPGGDFPVGGLLALAARIEAAHPWLPIGLAARLARDHGTEAQAMLQGCKGPDDLGPHFGAGLYGVEVDYLITREWARAPDDILFRRTRLGLRLDAQAVVTLGEWMRTRAKGSAAGVQDLTSFS